MQKKWLAVALVSALVCSAATAVQAEFKIGVVSTEVILRDSAAAQAASKKLEQEFSKRDKEQTDVCLLLNCHLVQYVRHDLTRVSATSNLLSLSDQPHKFFN